MYIYIVRTRTALIMVECIPNLILFAAKDSLCLIGLNFLSVEYQVKASLAESLKKAVIVSMFSASISHKGYYKMNFWRQI